MKLVKPAHEERETPRGVVGGSEISQATTGATNIFMGRFRVPPGAQSRPHYHENCESALYMLSGRIEIQWGDHLEDRAQRGLAQAQAGNSKYTYVLERAVTDRQVVRYGSESEGVLFSESNTGNLLRSLDACAGSS